ncbi:MAG: hypothetical protein LBT26_11785 [Clostridiales Family XIII bacterium]|jgi:uncharacterized membrane protein YfcA|nr:hypothetical protein [Clostridiales Family XIII bacterium]
MYAKKADAVIDIGLRILVFAYSATLLALAVWQLKRDRQFVIAIGIFALICTGIYLFDAVYRIATGKNAERLQKFIYGANPPDELPALRRVAVLVGFLIGVLVAMYLFGIFVIVFLTMAGFPVLYERRKPFVSVLVAVITTGAFYYVFVYMMGLNLYQGAIAGF